MTALEPAPPADTAAGVSGLGQCVVVGGGGAVGRLFADRLHASGAAVTVVDVVAAPRDPRFDHRAGDVTAIDPALAEELARADAVVLAVPEPVALAAVSGVAAAMRPGALLVDTLSVKGRIAAAVRSEVSGQEALSLNPMFAPSLGFTGRAVAAVVLAEGPLGAELLRLIGGWGGAVRIVSAEEHDRLAGATQALTHAAVLSFGLALTGMGCGLSEIAAVAPPPHRALLALLARIAAGTPEVYWDVQAANPVAVTARTALADAARRFADLVDHGTEADFVALLGDLAGFFGPDLDQHRANCARAFASIT